ncbi:MAG: hypothetical protein D6775_16595 [Caldilineae bacterium]|nr:MAG: hypothetical protein D6775_16595 [Caldilineae bacterium]
MTLQLQPGARVGIVGGGPAGSFAALHLLKLARQQKKPLEVLIFEPRDFRRPGPAGCNRCAGVLSYRLQQGLAQLDLTLPAPVIQAEIQAYAIHLHGNSLRIERPDPSRRIVSVYRGGGPRLLQDGPSASFDDFLLSCAVEQGAIRVAERVKRVTPADRPCIHTRSQAYPVDLLVIATGINSQAPLAPEFGYVPPSSAVMAQDEFLLPEEWPRDRVDAFFEFPPGLIFGAVIPKGRYLNISLLGEGLRLDAVEAFAEEHGLAQMLHPASGSLCGCTPRIATGMARHFFGDRWVTVGDAAVTRLYKDGIGSAYHTARVAMTTAMTMGISRRAFARGYLPYCRAVRKDNRYGQILFRLWKLTMGIAPLIHAWQEAIRLEAALPAPQKVHTRILWGMLTGDEPYRQLFWLSLTPGSLISLFRGLNHC